jgi:hypothetical protein
MTQGKVLVATLYVMCGTKVWKSKYLKGAATGQLCKALKKVDFKATGR